MKRVSSLFTHRDIAIGKFHRKPKKIRPSFSLLLLSLLCIILYSCEGETIDPDKAGRSLQLHAEIEGLKTRATHSSWENEDAIGVYMIKAGQPLNSSAISQNVKYVTAGSSTFKPADETEEIILPFDGSTVDFISYYPYRADINNFSFPIDLTDQSVQAGIDLMYSDNAKGFDSKNPNVRMQFTHQLSKIVLNIVHEQSIDLSELSVIISNAATRATFDLVSGNLSSALERGDIKVNIHSNGSVAEAILLPEPDLSGMNLWFVLDEEETEVYKFPLADVFEINAFESSTIYTYNVTLFTERIVAVTESNITAWIEGPSANVRTERTSETPPIIKGSKKKPFTVAEAQTNQGKTGVWVEGFIAGSTSGNSMNHFTPDVSEASNSNIVLADAPDETDTDKMIPVELGSGNIRAAVNLRENPDNLNKKVKIRGDLETYYRVPGLRDIKDYQWVGPEP
ncbi:fimbrillin family protein [Proteiniphilum sp. X52]|uniref:fimbrillin family protein n=1 Tax=Proteiniphilum sp. X52 TaxID=2382159 RepID=UPI000F0A97FA|nr:fimbrillin family protein [Proteiniphilum sp. X52]RNC65869.1 fimbrillin family protein [Proteiniphilum sp. X52]